MVQPSRQFKTRAWWWKYGVPLEKIVSSKDGREKRETYFLCRTCHLHHPKANCKLNITYGRAGALDHLKAFHTNAFMDNDARQDSVGEEESILEMLDLSDPMQQRIYNKLMELSDPDGLKKDILQWIIFDNIPFQKVDSPYFRAVLSRIAPFLKQDKFLSARTVRRWMLRELTLHKQDIRKLLHNSYGKIHLAFDIWTSRTNRALNGTVAHWVDQDGRCQTAVLALTGMADHHGGKEICANVLKVINDYNIRDRIGYFILDNAKNSDKAVEFLCAELELDPKWRRLRCAGHIINLIARQVLFGEDYEMFERDIALINDLKEEVELWRKKGPVGMIHSIVEWIRNSPGRLQRFHKVQQDLWRERHLTSGRDPPVLELILDNSTR
jgi:hypothetical protein